jgi:cytoskeleton protein RodZ
MQETIGQRLKRERESRYLSLEKAATDTRIRRIFIQALEADDYSVLPSAAQGRGFLRNYAEYLNLNIDELIAELQRNPISPAEVSGPLPQVNLAETEIPPLTESQDEEPAPRFWMLRPGSALDRILNRKPKVDSTPEAIQEPAVEEATSIQAEVPAAPVEVKDEPKTRGRKKKKIEEEVVASPVEVKLEEPVEQPSAEIQPEALEQADVTEEPKQGWWGSVAWLFKRKLKKQDAAEAVVVEPTVEDVLPAKPDKPADAIMVEIGAMLRERRELISLTFDEVERHTHLRAVFVKALEEGAFDKLPSTVQTRGMLSNYASFLDLDVDKVLLRYADALQARRHEKYAETPRDQIQTQVKPSMPILRMFIASDLLFGILMIAMLAGLAIWGVGRIIRLQEESQAEPTAPSIVDVLGNEPAVTASPELTFVAVDDPSVANSGTGVAELATPEVPVSTSTANVVVSVFALERTFVRISVDGEVVFEGRMSPRETKLLEANDQVVILSGDGSALRITYNGTDLGLMGGPGEVVNRVYLITGVATPTATIPPTPTNTPLTTPTFTPTSTPTPSATATLGQ